jgi:hypothetical protein
MFSFICQLTAITASQPTYNCLPLI